MLKIGRILKGPNKAAYKVGQRGRPPAWAALLILQAGGVAGRRERTLATKPKPKLTDKKKAVKTKPATDSIGACVNVSQSPVTPPPPPPPPPPLSPMAAENKEA